MSKGIIDIRTIIEAARKEGLLEGVVSITQINELADGRYELTASNGTVVIYPPDAPAKKQSAKAKAPSKNAEEQ